MERWDGRLEKYVEKLQSDEQIPGMALSVRYKGKLVLETYGGYRDIENRLPVNAETIFGAASITKSFVALAIMQLQDAGKLSVHDAVVDWLPAFRMPGRRYTGSVTIHHLLTHTSGLPGLDAVNQARAASIRNDPDGKYLFGDIRKLEKDIRTVDDVLDLIGEADLNTLGPPRESVQLLQ